LIKADELADAENMSVPKIVTGTSDHYHRNLITTSGGVKLNVPKLKGIPFETSVIERYCR
jgi:transposase-like protein